jgi:hypothetical protein
MALTEESVGPATLLKKGSSWLDSKVVFAVREKAVADAAMMVWKITKQLRARQGERGLSNTALSDLARIRRQTVSDVLMGVVWPDTRTLMRLCAALDLEITTVDKV